MRQARNHQKLFLVELSLPPASAGFLVHLLFNPEDGGYTFLLKRRIAA
jgi:hypothetical protein